MKHSGASEVHIALELLPGRLKLAVQDDGQGFDPGKRTAAAPGTRLVSGYGMAGIHERLRQIGGQVEIHSRPGQGARVELLVPIRGLKATLTAEPMQYI